MSRKFYLVGKRDFQLENASALLQRAIEFGHTVPELQKEVLASTESPQHCSFSFDGKSLLAEGTGQKECISAENFAGDIQTLRVDHFVDIVQLLPSACISSLLSLEMDCCPHGTFPEKICRISSLRNLKLKNCIALELGAEGPDLPISAISFTDLQALDLSGCTSLRSIPKWVGNLRRLLVLSLSGCSGLRELSPEIKNLTRLVELHLDGCSRLARLPDWLGKFHQLQLLDLSKYHHVTEVPFGVSILTKTQEMTLACCDGTETLPVWIASLASLEYLRAGAFRDLQELPEWLGTMTSLTYLDLDGCISLGQITGAVALLTNLHTLDLGNCRKITHLPLFLGSLPKLETLSLQGCSQLAQVPECIGLLTNLTVLNLARCSSILRLPESVEKLTQLTYLDLRGCEQMQELPGWMVSLQALSFLSLHGCSSLVELPEWLTQLQHLTTLDLQCCGGLERLPGALGSLSSLEFLILEGCEQMQDLPASISSLVNLRKLNAADSGLQGLPCEIGCLTQLHTLNLRGCHGLISLPQELGSLESMRCLDLRECVGLTELPAGLCQLSNLSALFLAASSLTEVPNCLLSHHKIRTLDLSCWNALAQLPNWMRFLTSLQTLLLVDNVKLRELPQWISTLAELRAMDLGRCGQMQLLPDSVGALSNLRALDLSGCNMLSVLPSSLASLSGLEALTVGGCDGMKDLPDWIASLSGLLSFHVRRCKGLKELPCTIGALTQLQSLSVTQCDLLQELPDTVSQLTCLIRLNLSHSASLTALPDSMRFLVRLRVLNLSYCTRLTAIPAWFVSLTSLVNLSFNGCTGLKEISAGMDAFGELLTLDFTNCNSLFELPQCLGLLTGLQSLIVPAMRTLPASVHSGGSKAILQYLRDLAQGATTCKLVKMMLLGNARAGKSSLLDSLISGTPSCRDLADRTVGIDVRRWRPSKSKDVVANVYDAAGHKVYRATHGIFISEETLFMITVKCSRSRSDAIAAAESTSIWLEALQQRIAQPLVILVFSHMDSEDGDTEIAGCELTEKHEMSRAVIDQLSHAMSDRSKDLDVVLKSKEEALRKELGRDDMWAAVVYDRDRKLQELDDLVDNASSFERGSPSSTLTLSGDSDGTSQCFLIRAQKIIQLTRQIDALNCDLDARVRTRVARLPPGRAGGSGQGVLRALVEVRDLRQKRLSRPTILASVRVSCRTGFGIEKLKAFTVEALEAEAIFPQLYRQVPINYVMLERLANPAYVAYDGKHSRHCSSDHGNSEGDLGVAATNEFAPEESPIDWTDWELAVSNHIEQHVSKKLLDLCQRPVVPLAHLLEEVSQNGMNEDELLRALRFLHAAGSVLFFEDRVGEVRLSEYVFLHPQWIIDAMKYVIREFRTDDLNDELREIDRLVNRDVVARHYLQEFKQSGEVREDLLRKYLWALPVHKHPNSPAGARKFPTETVGTLLDLMQRFRLLVPIQHRSAKTYIVPAMLEMDCSLPDQYITPTWIAPLEASAAIACMRRVFVTQRLPPGLLSEIQVRLAIRAKTSAQNLVSELTRGRGSVLSWTSGERGKFIKERVVISILQQEAVQDQGIRIMGWVTADKGAEETEWDLFKIVIEEVASAAACLPGLSMEEMIPVVDDTSGELATLLDASDCLGKDAIHVLVGDTTKDFTQLDLFPIKTPLNPKVKTTGQIQQLASGKPRLLAFYAQERADSLNLHREAESLTCVLEQSLSFETSIHPQPTFKTFHQAVMLACLNNVRIVHLAGHGDKDQGFFFLASKTGKQSEAIPPSLVSGVIGNKSTGKGGTVECVMLNACSTEAMAKLLRADGVPHVVCWRWRVHDGAATAFADAFYRQLDILARAGVDGLTFGGGYRCAFEEGRMALERWVLKGSNERRRITLETELQALPNVVAFLSVDGDSFPTPVSDSTQWGTDPLSPSESEMSAALTPQTDNSSILTLSNDVNRSVSLGCLCSTNAALLLLLLAATPRLSRTWRLIVRVLIGIPWAHLTHLLIRHLFRFCVDVIEARRASHSQASFLSAGEYPVDVIGFSEDSRMATNRQGDLEASAFAALGLKLEFPPGIPISNSVSSYRRGMLHHSRLQTYGLEEDERDDPAWPGRKHLRYSRRALHAIFRLAEFPDVTLQGYSCLFGEKGAMVRLAERARKADRRKTVLFLEASLQVRVEQIQRFRRRGVSCSAHDHMAAAIRKCLDAIKEME